MSSSASVKIAQPTSGQAEGDQSSELVTPIDSDSGHERTSSSSSATSNCSGDSSDNFDECRAELDEVEQDNDDDDEEDEHDHDLQQQQQSSDNVFLDCDGGAGTPTCVVKSRQSSNATNPNERANLRTRLNETTQILRMALSNEFIKALDSCADRAQTELYAGLAHATLSFLRAALTLERADLLAALASIQQAFEVSESHRKQVSAASYVVRLLYKPNYNSYTDDEIHAELVNAECMLLLSLISFLADQSVLCLVRGAFRIRACYRRYKECLFILEHRRDWSCTEARAHFESGVRMGYGIFNLLMSYLPRRVLKFLEYVGFSGSRDVGVHELDKSIQLDDGLRSVFSALVVLTWHSYVENLFGLGAYDERVVEHLSDKYLAHYPNSAFFLLFRGRYYQMRGQLSDAIEQFTRCCQVQQDWKQFHSICHWEIMWCYACQMNWLQAAHYANLLRQHSKWSPASYQYQYGTFLYAQLIDEQRLGLLSSDEYEQRLAEVRDIIKRVPDLRVRYAGKTIPADKFAITRASKFLRQQDRLCLPTLEFLYIWNIFCTLRNNPQQVKLILDRIELEIELIIKEQEQLENEKQTTTETTCDIITTEQHADDDEDDDDDDKNCYLIEDLCLMRLLQGMCLRHLHEYERAKCAFKQVLEHNEQIKTDTFLVPHATMELALLHVHLKQCEQAKHWIKLARTQYTGYLMETIVHFRLHAASRIVQIESSPTCLPHTDTCQ